MGASAETRGAIVTGGCERCWQLTALVDDIAQRVLAYGRRLNDCDHDDLEREGGWLVWPGRP
jgi:hypothetical protein